MAIRMDANGTHRQNGSDTLSFALGDVVGSTQLWEQHPDEMPGVLARIDTLVEDELLRRGGHRPAEQGEGDNFVVAFTRPSDALACAAALQAAFCAEQWPGGLPVAVRIAVHTGEVRHREGGRYMGETLNRCARLRALGHGGQVLVSGASAVLTAGALTDGLFLRDLGSHHLRDLSQPERVAQLCGPAMPFDFAPLRSLDRALTNLPVQLTSFVGRAAELAETTLLLTQRRFLTLAGAGGCGKTRLAMQLAAEVLDDFPDGVWFVDLAPIVDAEQVPRALASAAGVSELPGRALLDALADRLAQATALLVLDNCEHLLDGTAAVAETMLRQCPGIRVLVTSREPLGADGEATYRVPSLGLPAGADDAACESVTLFADRAALARPTMRFGPDDVAAAVAICARLDGIPLAIELAAARCRALTPTQIAQRLGAHFDLLTGGSRRALPRHRALEASIEWSHQLLDDDERALLHRLAVFSGGFTLEAAEAVGAEDAGEGWALVDLLSGLVDKSLVNTDDVGRYRLLETVRQFAESRLVASGEAAAARRRHAEYFLAFVEEAEPDLYGPDGIACTRRLAAELDNLRTAGDWAVESGDVDLAFRLMLPIDLFWQMHVVEGIDRLKQLLELPGASRDLRVGALSMGTEFECLNGDFANLAEWAEEGLALADEHTEPALRGYLVMYSGFGRMSLGDDDSLAMLQEGVELLRRATRPRHSYALLDGLWGEAFIRFSYGFMNEARDRAAEALDIARSSGSPISIGRSATFVGLFAAMTGNFDAARSALKESDDLLTGCGDALFLFFPRAAVGLVECLSDRRPDGYDRLAAQMDDARREHQYFGLQLGAWAMAVVAARGHGSSWREAVAEAEAMSVEMGFLWGAAWAQACAAENLIREGDLIAARSAAEAAKDILNSNLRAEFARGPVHLSWARLLLAQGDWAAAEEEARRGLVAAAASDLMLQQIEALELLAAIAARQGSEPGAARLIAAAARAREDIGFPLPPADEPVLAEEIVGLRAALDPDTFEAAWSEGAGMTLPDAVAYASRGRGPRRRPTSGWPSLTPTELDVAHLVAEGLRNPEIAAKLFVSPETVKTHVSNVLAKLGVANRTELAAQVARRA